jgi:RNA polymerase sigma factor (sigma-70 family)
MPTTELEPQAPVKPIRPPARGARTSASDAILVQRMRAGDERSFEAIFKRHHAPLLSYCRHMLASQDEAEDALQHTFIRAHRALLGEAPPRELRPWLYAIARNCCLSAIAGRRSTSELDERTLSLGGLSEEVHEREELRELVTDIARLPEDQRSALLLSELDDLSHRAIATVVGCPVSKVKALVYQARSTLMAEREARGASCRDIREQISVARGGELRRGPLRRHLRLCSGCRDFQLAVDAQRQSLAIVLPVLPSAALAARILGHGTLLHAAAGVGQAGAGAVPVGGSAAAGTSAAAGGGTGIAAAASGAAAGTTATAGATVAGGTGVGALIGGGLLAKAAVGGAVAALATVGTVTIPHRLWHPSRHAALGTAHSEIRSVPSLVSSDRAASHTAFVSTSGLSQAGGPAVQGASAEALQPGLSGLVSPAGDLEATTTGALQPSPSSKPSPPPGASGLPVPPSGAVAAVASRRSQARRARLRTLRHRRRLLARKRLLKRRVMRKKRRLLEQRRHRRQVSTPHPPAVAPVAGTLTHKPRPKRRTQTTSTPVPSPTPTAGGTTAKHRMRSPQGGGGASASPPSTGTTPAARKTGRGPVTGNASGPAAGESGSSTTGAGAGGSRTTGASAGGKRSAAGSKATGGGSRGAETGSPPASGKSAGGEAGSVATGEKTTTSGAGGSSENSGASGAGAHRKADKPALGNGGSASGGLPEENILDASQPSGQPLG